MIRCNKCGVEKPDSAYQPRRKTCRDCNSWKNTGRTDKRRGRSLVRADEGEYRKRRLKRYGVTVEWFANTLKRQRGRCAICKRRMEYTLCVDHDHSNGQVRGLLCISCNRGLGFFADDPVRLANAIAYLERHRVT